MRSTQPTKHPGKDAKYEARRKVKTRKANQVAKASRKVNR